MERELGISYLSALPTRERQKYQKEVLSLSKFNQELSSRLQKRQEEQKKMEGAILELEEEKKRLQEKVTHKSNLTKYFSWPKINYPFPLIAEM